MNSHQRRVLRRHLFREAISLGLKPNRWTSIWLLRGMVDMAYAGEY
jgi:hypothetical protein